MEKEFINPDGVPKVPSYSQAVAVTGGKTIYISGQVSVNANGETVGAGDLAKQVKQTLENLKTVLAASGATFGDVVKLTYFVKDFKPETLSLIREIRGEYLPNENPPASTLIGVTSLASEDFLIEIEAVVTIP
jgi:enamine deaminase RidA (YjgF/YER057c/UK114 family)